jgi:hypothetical protein
VHDYKAAEDAVLAAFRCAFVHVKDTGREYFKGSHAAVLSLFSITVFPFSCPPIALLVDEDDDAGGVSYDIALFMSEDEDAGGVIYDIALLVDEEDEEDDAVGVIPIKTPEAQARVVLSNDVYLNIHKFVTAHISSLASAPIKLVQVHSDFHAWVESHATPGVPQVGNIPYSQCSLFHLLACLRSQFGVKAKPSAVGMEVTFKSYQPEAPDITIEHRACLPDTLGEWLDKYIEVTGSCNDFLGLGKMKSAVDFSVVRMQRASFSKSTRAHFRLVPGVVFYEQKWINNGNVRGVMQGIRFKTID